MILRCLGPRAFAAVLLLSAAAARAEVVEVVRFDAEWEWLMIFSPGTLEQVDPVSVDPDFLATWTTPAYNGPPFQRNPAPLSYGGVNFPMNGSVPPGTLMPTPGQGTRATVYCRITFDLPGELTDIKLETAVDDGFLLYVDGARWVSMNMRPGATSAFGEMAVATGNQTDLSIVHPGTSLPAGRHTMQLSMHNNSVNSTDLGFMLRLTGELHPPLVPTLTLEASAPSIDGSPRLLLRAKDLNPSVAAIVQMSTNLSNWSLLFEAPPAPERTEFTIDLPAAARRRFFRLVQ